MNKKLSKEDVEKLLADPSVDTRAETAAKIASDFGAGALNDTEVEVAQEIFRIMVKDAEVRVREALSQNLKENPLLPHDVAVNLANDVDTVALPVLRFSDVLTDADLVEIVRSQGQEKLKAIAGRSAVSETVSEALVETHDEETVAALVANEGAEISETAFQKVVDEFGDKENIQVAMVHRPSLPVTVSERLVTMVSEHLKEELATRHELDADLATDLILQSRERATISLSSESSEAELQRLIDQLYDNGRLTPSIVLRALCVGDMNFYEFAMAKLTGASLANIRMLIHDSGTLGLKGAYQKAGLPMAQFPAVRAAIDVAAEMDYDGREQDRERYSRRMIERILTQYGELGVELESDDLEYLLAKMNELPSDAQDAAQ